MALEPFRVTGRFTIVERKRDTIASEAFAALGRDDQSAPLATGR